VYQKLVELDHHSLSNDKKLNVFFCTMKFPHYFIGALQCNLSNFLACSNVKMLQVNFCSAPLKTSLSGA